MNYKKVLIHFMQALIVIGSILIILLLMPSTQGGLYGFIAFPTGSSPYCSFWDKWDAGRASIAYMNRTKEISASLRILRTEGKFQLVSSIHGNWWIPANSKYLVQQFGELDRGIYGKISGGEIVLDCGANVGQYSKQLLEQGAAKVIAIEPAPENLECLRRNLFSEIEQGRVIIYPKGVWNKDDVLPMNVSDKYSRADSFVLHPEEEIGQILLPLTTIDQIVEELDLPRVDVIKMDIEGAERNALKGAEKTLAKHHPRLAICIYHRPDDPNIIIRLAKKIVPSYKVSCKCYIGSTGLYPEVAHFDAASDR